MLAQLIAINVFAAGDPPVPVPQPYAEPTATDLKARYPAFAAVSVDTIAYWLADAHRYVDTLWMAGDYAPALIARAAYAMTVAGVPGIAGGDISGFAAAGVTDFQSGAFRARFSDEAVKVAVAGGYASNVYGIEYAELLFRNKAGTRITNGGVMANCNAGYNGYAGPLPGYIYS